MYLIFIAWPFGALQAGRLTSQSWVSVDHSPDPVLLQTLWGGLWVGSWRRPALFGNADLHEIVILAEMVSIRNQKGPLKQA